MTKDEIRSLLKTVLDQEASQLDVPSEGDWASLAAALGASFPPEFKAFIELMAEFSFPGDIYNVSASGRTNGNDTIATVYANERQHNGWPEELIPFYGIGNGDYFALGAKDGAVYYRYHEDGRVERYNDSFEAWLRKLPGFLNPEAT